ncbi:DUF6773 family protein [uncultured Clostridium sp.]|uniref:DUF6773 family protein n=1 Tax=uncultured Clostridium sp. TaxID=59620 RepID=UPI0028E8D4DD|nr:DUF6773 family protein [uncultured Clostridium sp.]
MKDERIEQATNKIRSELTLLIYGIAVISFLTKSWIYNMDLSRCWTEYIILILTPLYQFVRARSMKISLHTNNSSKQSFKVLAITFAALIAIISTFVYKTVINNSNYDFKKAVCNVLVFTILFIFIYFRVNKSEQKQVKKYEDKFDD